MWIAGVCDKCNNTGYKGRIGIYEGIKMTEDINKVIEYSSSEGEVAKAALPQGILNMTQDGIIKILSGVTSIEELERVIELEE